VSEEDRDLISAARLGDMAAFLRIYERYKSDVLTLASALLGHADGAEDVLHDVFVSLAEGLPHRQPPVNLKGYLLTSAANRVRDSYRRAKREPEALDEADPVASAKADDPAALAADSEQARHLWNSVLSLPDEQRDVVALKIYGGLTFKEVAERTGTPMNTVQSRYRYALDKLRAMLQQEDVQ
jgi:RNA polymerase sigma-70 factor (ECF subfamily)